MKPGHFETKKKTLETFFIRGVIDMFPAAIKYIRFIHKSYFYEQNSIFNEEHEISPICVKHLPFQKRTCAFSLVDFFFL